MFGIKMAISLQISIKHTFKKFDTRFSRILVGPCKDDRKKTAFKNVAVWNVLSMVTCWGKKTPILVSHYCKVSSKGSIRQSALKKRNNT